MKIVLWGVGLVLLAAALFGLGWFSHAEFSKTPSVAKTAPHDTPMMSSVAGTPGSSPMPPASAHSPFMMPNEREQLYAARQAALQGNPDLSTQYKSILADIQAQQSQIKAAMIKVDPKIEPLLARLDALRQHGGPESGQNSITPQDFQQVQAAHHAAFQANPDLLAANKKLIQRMHDLDAELESAMIKTDPSLAPIIAKYEAGRHPPGMTGGVPPPTSPSVK